MLCSKCKKPFPKNKDGGDITGMELSFDKGFFDDNYAVEAKFCSGCWMEIWGVTKYLKPKE